MVSWWGHRFIVCPLPPCPRSYFCIPGPAVPAKTLNISALRRRVCSTHCRQIEIIHFRHTVSPAFSPAPKTSFPNSWSAAHRTPYQSTLRGNSTKLANAFYQILAERTLGDHPARLLPCRTVLRIHQPVQSKVRSDRPLFGGERIAGNCRLTSKIQRGVLSR